MSGVIKRIERAADRFGDFIRVQRAKEALHAAIAGGQQLQITHPRRLRILSARNEQNPPILTAAQCEFKKLLTKCLGFSRAYQAAIISSRVHLASTATPMR